jgi:uncharacterized protein YciI
MWFNNRRPALRPLKTRNAPSLFCIVGFDTHSTDTKREQLRDKHMEYLRDLKNKNKLFSAGPLLTEHNKACGSVLIVDFDNQIEAENWFSREPFNLSGVYKEIKIYPYIDAMPHI